MPRGTAEDTRDRILKAADSLFYRRGIIQTSIDEVAERAKVSKKTVYYHYATKKALVEAYLAKRDEATLDWLKAKAEAAGPAPLQQLTGLFDALAAWSATSAFNGCPFLRGAVELSGSANKSTLSLGARHKQRHLSWMTDLARRADAHDPDTLGRQLLLLTDGAIAEALVTGDPAYFAAARNAAAALLEVHSSP